MMPIKQRVNRISSLTYKVQKRGLDICEGFLQETIAATPLRLRPSAGYPTQHLWRKQGTPGKPCLRVSNTTKRQRTRA